MKRLTLIRHAKSSWDSAALDDHDRPLNQRGLHAAPAIGKALAERGLQADLFVSSTALRAITTAKIIADELDYPHENIAREGQLYGASAARIRDLARSLPEEHDSVLFFAHNPGIEIAASNFAPGADIPRFITCAVASIEFDIDHWALADFGDGRLAFYIDPKSI